VRPDAALVEAAQRSARKVLPGYGISGMAFQGWHFRDGISWVAFHGQSRTQKEHDF